MARTPKAPKNTELPNNPAERKLLNSILDEIVGYMIVGDNQKQYITGAKETLTDKDGKLNLCPKYAGRLIKAAYDTVKLQQVTKEQQEALDDFKILKGE